MQLRDASGTETEELKQPALTRVNGKSMGLSDIASKHTFDSCLLFRYASPELLVYLSVYMYVKESGNGMPGPGILIRPSSRFLTSLIIR